MVSNEYHFEHVSVYPQNYISLIDTLSEDPKINKAAHAIHYGAKTWVPPGFNIGDEKWRQFICEYEKKEINRVTAMAAGLFHVNT